MVTKLPAFSQKIITVSGVLLLFHTIPVREKVLTQRQRADRHRKPCRHRDAMDSQQASLTSRGLQRVWPRWCLFSVGPFAVICFGSPKMGNPSPYHSSSLHYLWSTLFYVTLTATAFR